MARGRLWRERILQLQKPGQKNTNFGEVLDSVQDFFPLKKSKILHKILHEILHENLVTERVLPLSSFSNEEKQAGHTMITAAAAVALSIITAAATRCCDGVIALSASTTFVLSPPPSSSSSSSFLQLRRRLLLHSSSTNIDLSDFDDAEGGVIMPEGGANPCVIKVCIRASFTLIIVVVICCCCASLLEKSREHNPLLINFFHPFRFESN